MKVDYSKGIVEMLKNTEGVKYDTGKPRIAEMIQDFREPLIEVAKVWAFGADKYSKGNWAYVLNGRDRYTNAMIRHLVAEVDNSNDAESELLHAAHVAWNALARLWFIIQEQKPKTVSEGEVKDNEPWTIKIRTQKRSEELYD